METPAWIQSLDTITDPRTREGRYTIGEVLFLIMAGLLAGHRDLVAIAEWGEDNLDWLRRYQGYAEGTPSHDTLGRVLGRIRPSQVQAVFSRIVRGLLQQSPPAPGDRHVAIDGKTLRGSRSATQDLKAEHALHAWDVQLRQVIGLCWTDTKSNEITALPVLLDDLDLRGVVITLDAMGTQWPVMTQIMAGGGHVIMGLKGNQGTLHRDAQLLFDQPPARVRQSSHVADPVQSHGRVEQRTTTVIDITPAMAAGLGNQDWPLASLVRVISSRAATRKGHPPGEASLETRYYVSTLPIKSHPAERQGALIRAHWSVENHLHRTLDVSFSEDADRVRDRNVVQNLAHLRRLAMSILGQFPNPRKRSLTGLMHQFDRKTSLRHEGLAQWAKALAPPSPKRTYQALRG